MISAQHRLDEIRVGKVCLYADFAERSHVYGLILHVPGTVFHVLGFCFRFMLHKVYGTERERAKPLWSWKKKKIALCQLLSRPFSMAIT